MRALDRDDVARLLNHADHVGFTAGVGADHAARLVGQVEADLALADLALDLEDRLGERRGLLVIGAQDVECEPLRGAVADPGQA